MAYGSAEAVHSDETFPTRLGPEQVTLVLARRATDDTLSPWAADEPHPTRAWALSEVKMPRTAWERTGGVDQEEDAVAAVRKDWKDWKAWKDGRFYVCPVGEDGVIAKRLLYGSDTGLVIGPPSSERG